MPSLVGSEMCIRDRRCSADRRPTLAPVHSHARLMADLLLTDLVGQRFEWGRRSLVAVGDLRARYIARSRLWASPHISSAGWRKRGHAISRAPGANRAAQMRRPADPRPARSNRRPALAADRA